MKDSAPEKGIIVKLLISSELNPRCQVDLIGINLKRDITNI